MHNFPKLIFHLIDLCKREIEERDMSVNDDDEFFEDMEAEEDAESSEAEEPLCLVNKIKSEGTASDDIKPETDIFQDDVQDTKPKYKCDVCDKIYCHKSDMRRHRRIHYEVSFRCSQCPVMFESQAALEKHEELKHGLGNSSVGEHFLAQLVDVEIVEGAPLADKQDSSNNIDHGRLYSCEICDVHLKDKKSLDRHMKKHVDLTENAEKPKGYTCEQCSLHFRDKRGLERHNKIHLKPHVCSHCKIRFASEKQLNEHLAKHETLKEHACEICNQVYSSARNLKRHMLIHLNANNVSCPVCNKEFSLEKNLKFHMKQHEQTTCQECRAVFDTEVDLQQHVCILQCHYCKEMFASKSTLEEHLRNLHAAEEPISAPDDVESASDEDDEIPMATPKELNPKTNEDDDCGEGDNVEDFKGDIDDVDDELVENDIEEVEEDGSIDDLDMENGMSDGEKADHTDDHMCILCGAKCSTSAELKTHMNAHMGDKRSLNCIKCNKNFTTMTNLRRHLLHHEKNTCKMCGLFFVHAKSLEIHDCGYTPYCSICHRPFNSKREYRLHMSSHGIKEEDDKNQFFVCPDCGKKFAKFMNFRAHRASHTGEKPFVCRDCGEGFLSATALRIHRRVHTGKKYFSCEQCDATFVYEFKLKQHLLTHKSDAEMPFHCPHCHQGFVAKSGLLRHEVVCQSHPAVNKEENAEAMRKQRLYNRSKVGKNPNKKCHECGETFLRYDQFLLHMRTHNEKAELPLQCSYCIKGFVHEYNRRQHERFCMKRSAEEREERLEKEKDYNLYKTFKGQKVFKCMECKQMFRYRHKFILHQETHKSDADKPYHCPLCLGGFVSRSGLKRHGMHCARRSQKERGQRQKKKIKEKRLKEQSFGKALLDTKKISLWCADCGAGFSSKQDLASHRATCVKAAMAAVTSIPQKKEPVVLTPLKEYKCPICGRVFHFSHVLKLHMDAHNGIYPFQCKICERGFTLKSSFLLHKCAKNSSRAGNQQSVEGSSSTPVPNLSKVKREQS